MKSRKNKIKNNINNYYKKNKVINKNIGPKLSSYKLKKSDYQKENIKKIQKNSNFKSNKIEDLLLNNKNKINVISNDILDNNKPNVLPINIIKKILTELNEFLKIMRKNNYYHRDLKPDNILIKFTDKNKTNFDIKLTDFGLSSNEINTIFQNHSNVGSEKYRAPEVDYFEYNNKSDLWSLGIILYELYTNKYIFDSKNLKEKKINREKGRIVNETDNEMINKLIRKLIQVDINKRIGWKEYFYDDFFKKEEKEKNKEK